MAMKANAFFLVFFSLSLLPALSYAEKYAAPDELLDEFESIGFNEFEMDEVAVDDEVLVIKLDSEKLSLKRFYQIVKTVCTVTKENPDIWDDTPFSNIEVMNGIQTVRVIFNGSNKECLDMPSGDSYQFIESRKQIKY
ncbi:hypothetical protein FXN80_14710 [Dickeya fangzhongdai]|uniref:hypothetical protein n=2 Tax=Dickeya TaxID=204037 RepID=UPI00136C7672|nr:hypothetical protein [Dickeya fangzhongdai]UMB75364.1 hypothetical protein FXN80_14710 [Dickeya fangzhongdai]